MNIVYCGYVCVCDDMLINRGLWYISQSVSETAEAACFSVVMPTGCRCGMAMDLGQFFGGAVATATTQESCTIGVILFEM